MAEVVISGVLPDEAEGLLIETIGAMPGADLEVVLVEEVDNGVEVVVVVVIGKVTGVIVTPGIVRALW